MQSENQITYKTSIFDNTFHLNKFVIMKKGILTLYLSFIALFSFGQDLSFFEYSLNFENSIFLEHLQIDTISNKNNIWQIGPPQKSVFKKGFSIPNVIVTDTINSYPINNTSSFIIRNLAGVGFDFPHTVVLAGSYYVNSDTLSDYGTIEFSPDNGKTWIDLINSTSYPNEIQWYTIKPVLTGNSNGWRNFNVNLAPLGPQFNIKVRDTVQYRFTFISDGDQSNKDGLMFDDIHFEDWAENVAEIKNDHLISIYPNPTSNALNIKSNSTEQKGTIRIMNCNGQLMQQDANFSGNTLDTKALPNGIYSLYYSDTNYFTIKRFVVQH